MRGSVICRVSHGVHGGPRRARYGNSRASGRDAERSEVENGTQFFHHPGPRDHERNTVFSGTRVPVASLFAHLRAGDTIEDFLAGIPGVAREQVAAVLERTRLDPALSEPGSG
ncbi:DUF433 domain-containing protein [Longimicrobium sp.]|uniref:DUF433 domain-containing protein n=1 Tax=Longimicrobium sp. TaxID=2029185 RepID=UPI0032C23A1A